MPRFTPKEFCPAAYQGKALQVLADRMIVGLCVWYKKGGGGDPGRAVKGGSYLILNVRGAVWMAGHPAHHGRALRGESAAGERA